MSAGSLLAEDKSRAERDARACRMHLEDLLKHHGPNQKRAPKRGPMT
jgi:hypothetical protein